MTTLSFAMLRVFRNKNVQVYALDGVESVSMSSFTQPDTTKDVYTCSLSSGISEKTATLTLIIKDAGTLKIAYTNSAGSLTITNTAAGFSYTASGNTTTAVTLDIGLASGDNTIVFTCKSKSWWGANGVAQIELLSIDRTQGISGTTITEGFGTTDNPYIVDEQDDFAVINQALSAVYSLKNDISLTGTFTPIGSATTAFSGTFLGNGHTISNMTISGGTYRGMFAQTNGGTIKDLTLNNFNITGASTYSAMLIGYAVNGTVVENVNLYGKVSAVAGDVGGVVGYANGTDAVKVKNCNVYGSVSTTATWNIGGLSGAGGTFENCVVYANVSGVQLVGGITGGYKDDIGDLEKLSGAQFGSYTNCYVAGDVAITGIHNNNYPYWGLVNGYGAYCKYTLSNVGQRISFTYTTSVDVEEIRVFNSNVNPDGLVVSPTSTGEGYSFTQDVTLTNTYAGGSSNASSLSSETAVTGITGNYGGLTIRFKMADGKYKYISTLNKAESKFQSVFDVNLDNLTSYVDNFSSIEIDTSVGTGSYTTSDSISVWGTAKVANANDFEHLSWIINGAIPTTFANGVYYNARSVATLSISLQADIDLTTLNPTNHNFYGLGKTEMYPYRGSIYGNGHSLTVNMNFPNAYLMGIICVSTDQENQIVVENLTINGTIAGRYRVGIVGMNDNYTRTCSVAFTNVTNNANITALSQVGAFVGEAQGGGGSFGTKENAKIYLTNCVNNGNITATAGDAGGLVGTLNHIHNAATYAVVTLKNCANNGNVSATGYAGGFVAGISNTVTIEGTNINSGVVISSSGKANFYVANIGSGSFSTTDGLQTIYKINLGVAGKSWTISSSGASLYNSANEIVTSATYTANDFGIISVKFANLQTFSGVSLSLNVPLLKEPITITPTASNTDEFYNDVDYKKTMATSVIVPIDIQMWDENHNVYNITSSTDSWILKADVTFNCNLSGTNSNVETIDLVPYVGDAKLDTLLDSNQLVFVAVTFDHATYNIPETFSQ
ncbi:MAG: hypothetical protein IJ415_01790, partial [Clostridia bacterium]|nr:hypothetical protein [Clostridia bacterium]